MENKKKKKNKIKMKREQKLRCKRHCFAISRSPSSMRLEPSATSVRATELS